VNTGAVLPLESDFKGDYSMIKTTYVARFGKAGTLLKNIMDVVPPFHPSGRSLDVKLYKERIRKVTIPVLTHIVFRPEG
jgi:hypothetical protein